MLPQPLHTRTMWCHRTTAILVLALGSMSQQQQALLLMSQNLLTIRDLASIASVNIANRRLLHRQHGLLHRRLSSRGLLILHLYLLRSLLRGMLQHLHVLSLLLTHNGIDICHIHHPLLLLRNTLVQGCRNKLLRWWHRSWLCVHHRLLLLQLHWL